MQKTKNKAETETKATTTTTTDASANKIATNITPKRSKRKPQEGEVLVLTMIKRHSAKKDLTAYQIMQITKKPPGVIYPMLNRLVENGILETKERTVREPKDRSNVAYQLTADGRQHLKQYIHISA